MNPRRFAWPAQGYEQRSSCRPTDMVERQASTPPRQGGPERWQAPVPNRCAPVPVSMRALVPVSVDADSTPPQVVLTSLGMRTVWMAAKGLEPSCYSDSPWHSRRESQASLTREAATEPVHSAMPIGERKVLTSHPSRCPPHRTATRFSGDRPVDRASFAVRGVGGLKDLRKLPTPFRAQVRLGAVQDRLDPLLQRRPPCGWQPVG